MLTAILLAAAAAALAAVIVAVATGKEDRAAQDLVDTAHGKAAAALEAAKLEAGAARTAAETAARTEALTAREAAAAELARAADAQLARGERIAKAEADVRADGDELDAREAAIDQRHKELQSRRDRANGLEQDVNRKASDLRKELEQRAHTSAKDVARALQTAWLDDARAAAAAKIRLADQATADPAIDREGLRVMEIAIGRYQNHFLTERNVSNLRVGPQIVELLLADGGALHAALEQVSNVKLLINDEHDAVRLDGLDGVGREIARRALGKLFKKPETAADAKRQPLDWSQKFKTHVDQEIRTLGKKAFQVLEIQKAHPEIVELVGALNYRTSYTQNQWLHAVESSFLAGIMAAELGLDEKLARRATLMHDIGKALTHKIEGSHAVIGADIARRLGESELVANAIGAHHTDEPFNSPYAYLVAAADAMSGARPGARREQTEGFSTKIEDLERIGLSYKGVGDAQAVFGGRELRVYVREQQVDDLRTVELSQEIASQISEEMTFPGQIKVTVIRAFEAVSNAN
ncbi:MAG TPA: HDIG domain-containing protein [Kofleriaceae bacterium]|nr:HDIG domain-containing protein [Kofleriaceae bacterium]